MSDLNVIYFSFQKITNMSLYIFIIQKIIINNKLFLFLFLFLFKFNHLIY